MQIHQSAEDYLETILMLNQRMGRVRSIDVVNELGYTKDLRLPMIFYTAAVNSSPPAIRKANTPFTAAV